MNMDYKIVEKHPDTGVTHQLERGNAGSHALSALHRYVCSNPWLELQVLSPSEGCWTVIHKGE